MSAYKQHHEQSQSYQYFRGGKKTRSGREERTVWQLCTNWTKNLFGGAWQKHCPETLCVPAAPSPACPPCSWPWQHRLNPLCPWNLSSPSSHPALPSRDPCSSSSEWDLNCSDSNAESHEEQLPGTPDCSGFQPQAPPSPPASIHHQQSLGLTPVCRQCQLWALPSAELWVLALAACCTYACSWLFPERQISVRGRFERGLRNQTSAVT